MTEERGSTADKEHQATRSGLLHDDLNARIGVLSRREAEARILAPIIDALGSEFGHEQVLEVVRDTIVQIAREQGTALVEMVGGDSLDHFRQSLEYWTKDDALEIEVIEHSANVFSFDVRRCRYAEIYHSLGIPELGALFSCNRDYALIEGFNAEVELARTQTIMEGADCCDFRYRRTKDG